MGSPTQAEPLPSAVRPTRLTAPVGCAWESRTPVELPRYSVAMSCSAKPASTASRARARPNAPDRGREDALERSRSRSPRGRARSHAAAGRASAGSRPGRTRRRPAAPPGHRPGGRRHLGHAVGADLAGAPGGAERPAGERDDADRAAAAARRWSSSCSARSARRHGCSPRPARCTRPPRARPPPPGRARPAPGRGSCRQRPDSSRVFRTRTPRTSTDGQPWLTGAT